MTEEQLRHALAAAQREAGEQRETVTELMARLMEANQTIESLTRQLEGKQ